MVATSTSSRWAAPLRSMLTGFAFFFLGSLSDVWLQQHVASRSVAIMDDALVGIGAGLLVLLYERRQRQNMIRKLEVIRMMNHHVRNALQVISAASSVSEREELAKNIHTAVERIEWALREVLPGQREDISSLSFHPHSGGSTQKPTTVA
jgi:signal transduction histidine kinase